MAANNLGTAYIKIAPQMQGIQKSISDGLAGIKSTSLPGAAALGTVIAKGVSAAMNLVSSSIDGAISRVDTLNTFPKIMKNLGFEAEESSSAVNKLSDRIEGLPTTLDEIVTYTQRLASTTGNLNKGMKNATSIAIAFNDAALAGGKGQIEANRAFEQFVQVISRGRPSMQDWKILMEVMPGQLKQLAKYMYSTNDSLKDYAENAKKTADDLDGMDLYEWISADKSAFAKERLDDFTTALVELDEKGGDGITSFKDQVGDATHTIGTAMRLIPVRITKALATVVQAFGAGDIYDAIDKFTSSFGDIANWIAANIVPVVKNTLIPVLKNALSVVKNVVEFIAQNKWVQNTIMGIVSAMLAFKAVGAVKNVITGVISPIISLTKNLATGVGAFKSAMDAGLSFGSAMGNVASNTTGITSKIAGLGQTLTTTHGAVGGFVSKLLGISAAAGGAVLAVEGVKAMIEINKIQTIEATTAAREYAREHYNVAQAAESAKRAQDLLKGSINELKDAEVAATDAEIQAIEARKNQTYYLDEMNRLKEEGKQNTDEYRLAELNYTKAIREEKLANDKLAEAQENVKNIKTDIDNLNSSNLYRGNLLLGSILREKQEYGNLAVQLDELKTKTLQYKDEQGNMVEASLQKSQEMVEGLAQQLAQGDSTWAAIVAKANEEGISFAEACAKYGAEGGSNLIGNFKTNAEFNLPLVNQTGQETVDTVRNSLHSLGTVGSTAGGLSMNELAGGIRSKVGAVKSAATEASNNVKIGAQSATGFWEIGANFVRGIVKGINDTKGKLFSDMATVVKTTVQKARDAGLIKSPSRATAEVGKYLSLGLAKGINDYADEAISAAEDMTERTIDAMNEDYNPNLSMNQLQPQTALTGSQNGSQGQVIQYNDFTVDSELDVKEISKRLGWQVATAL